MGNSCNELWQVCSQTSVFTDVDVSFGNEVGGGRAYMPGFGNEIGGGRAYMPGFGNEIGGGRAYTLGYGNEVGGGRAYTPGVWDQGSVSGTRLTKQNQCI